MKHLSLIMIVVAVACWATAFLQTPIMKMPTSTALERIEADYIRPDLKKEEKKQLDFYISWIRSNQTTSYSAFQNSLICLTFLGVTVIIQNVLIIRNKKRNK